MQKLHILNRKLFNLSNENLFYIKITTMLNVFDSSNKRRIKTHLRNLIHIANIDGHFDDSEKAIVTKMAQKFGVTNEELEQMIAEDDHYDYHPPFDLEERFELLYDIFMMITADEQVTDSELRMFKILALGLNINHEKVDTIFQFMIDNATPDADPDELFKGFKKVLLRK